MAEDEKTYQLKDTNTSFYDDETKLEVTRDQKVSIGPGAGKKTMQMIAKGGLVEVEGEPAPATGTGPTKGEEKDALPEDFPGKDKFEAAGYKTLSSVRALSDEQLKGIKDVGPKTIEQVHDYLK